MSKMQYGAVLGVDKPVARMVLGTMIVNTRELDQSFRLLDAVHEMGGTTLDTAHVYAGGDSERAIGEWMQARGNREQIVILSKGCHHSRDRKRMTPYDLAADLHDSLARLKTDYIDIYLLHRDDPDLPVGPIVEAFNEHWRDGKIRAFGGSNWTHERLAEANAYALERGLQPMTASSPNYGLAQQIEDPWAFGCVTISGPENEDARAWYRQNDMPVFAYSSLARGLFSGRIDPDDYEACQDLLDDACRRAYCHAPNFERLRRTMQLAEEKDCTVPQIVLAFLLHAPLNVFPLVGAASGDEFAENLNAFDLSLSAQELAWLDLRADNR